MLSRCIYKYKYNHNGEKRLEMDSEKILSEVKELDSRDFWYVFLDNPSLIDKIKAVAPEAILELQRQEDAESLVRLGHLHLLLKNYSKALSAYQEYFNLVKNCKNPAYFYGLGIIFLMHNSYQLATIAFQQVLYVDPGSKRAIEVHIRLGIIAMENHDFETGLKHFTMAKNDPSEGRLTVHFDIQFNIAHLHEVCGKHREAMTLYTDMLEDERLSSQLRADIYCRIGWMLNTVEKFGEKEARKEKAIQFLIRATNHETNKSGWAHYLLGQCYESIGSLHDAWKAYRDSLVTNDRKADVWCSMGIIYVTQNYSVEAIECFHHAVKLDEYHWAAWRNLYGVNTVMARKNPKITSEAAIDALSKADDALTFLFTNIPRTVNMTLSPKQRMEYLEDQMSVSVPVQMMQLTRHRLNQNSLQKFKHQMTLELKLTSEYQAPPPIPPQGLFSDQLGCCTTCTRGPRPGADI